MRRPGVLDLVTDKSIDFVLIFVGLYAATGVQRWQEKSAEKDEYVALLRDFKGELDANLEQEASIARDLGPIESTEPGKNLGPMQDTFRQFFGELEEDEKVVLCLHTEFVSLHEEDAPPPEGCHELYGKFDAAHADHGKGFNFEPAALTPFYRREVWQLYLADGIKSFRNKELAVRIAEVYANSELIEEMVESIEATYNDGFMAHVGRTTATDMLLAQVVHDVQTAHSLSEADVQIFLGVEQAIRDEHYASLEIEHRLELEVERMKETVLVMRGEIEAVQEAIDDELMAQSSEPR